MPVGVEILNNGQKLQISSQTLCMHRRVPDGSNYRGVLLGDGQVINHPFGAQWRYRDSFDLAQGDYIMVGIPLIVGGAVEVFVGGRTTLQNYPPGTGFDAEILIFVYAKNAAGQWVNQQPEVFTVHKRNPAGAPGVGLQVAYGPNPAFTSFDSRAFPLSVRQKLAFAAGSAGSASLVSGLTTPAIIGPATCAALEGWRYDYYVEPDPPFTTGGTFSQDYTRQAIGGWTLSAGGVLSRDPRAFLAADPNAGYFVQVLSQGFSASQAMIYDQWRYA